MKGLVNKKCSHPLKKFLWDIFVSFYNPENIISYNGFIKDFKLNHCNFEVKTIYVVIEDGKLLHTLEIFCINWCKRVERYPGFIGFFFY